MTYEYAVIHCDEFAGFPVEKLNQLGSQGFKVVGMTRFSILLMKECV